MIDNQEKRLYQFSHFMISTMTKGIQNTHSAVELFNKYLPNPSNNELSSELDAIDLLWDWSLNWKTVISLNGGITPDLMELIEFLEYNNCPYPWTFFNEDESLGELVTSIALVLPERIYETAALIRNNEVEFITTSGSLRVLNWEAYNASFRLYEFEELQSKVNSHGIFTEFEIELINKLNTYRLAS